MWDDVMYIRMHSCSMISFSNMTLVASFSTKLLILRKTSGKKYNIYGNGPFRFDFLWLVCECII